MPFPIPAQNTPSYSRYNFSFIRTYRITHNTRSWPSSYSFDAFSFQIGRLSLVECHISCHITYNLSTRLIYWPWLISFKLSYLVEFAYLAWSYCFQEKLYQWIWRQQEGGSRVTTFDIINYLQVRVNYSSCLIYFNLLSVCALSCVCVLTYNTHHMVASCVCANVLILPYPWNHGWIYEISV
jgi:hypothetical protein